MSSRRGHHHGQKKTVTLRHSFFCLVVAFALFSLTSHVWMYSSVVVTSDDAKAQFHQHAPTDRTAGTERTSMTRRESTNISLAQLNGQADVTNRTEKSLTLAANNLFYSNDQATAAVEPLWECGGGGRRLNKEKFVFVHVFKTAGSSMRVWLSDYSKRCGYGYATITSCTGVDPNTMKHNKKFWNPCVMERYQSKRGKEYLARRPVDNSFMERHVDVVAGHLRIGSTNHLRIQRHNPTTTKDEAFTVRHFSFFRNAVSKFVSAKVYIKAKKKPTLGALMDDICRHATSSLKKKWYYTRYSDYLLTPQQRLQFPTKKHQEESLIQNVTKTIMDNLLRYNVLVGIMERMPESMQLLQHALGDTTTRTTNSSTTPIQHLNPSVLSSSRVLQAIQEDRPECHANLVEYVKYEQRITDFAMEMHLKQYNAIQKQLLK